MKLRFPRIRIARAYLIEAFMIVFSVMLALMLNEVRNSWMENRQTRQILKNVQEEIARNQQIVQKLGAYHDSVLQTVDRIMESDSLQALLIGKRGFNLYMLAPMGIIQDNISDTSWDIALNSNIALRTDFKTTELLTELYNQQKLVLAAVDTLVAIVESRDLQKKENLHETLILLRLAFNELKGRENSLLQYYKDAQDQLKAY